MLKYSSLKAAMQSAIVLPSTCRLATFMITFPLEYFEPQVPNKSSCGINIHKTANDYMEFIFL